MTRPVRTLAAIGASVLAALLISPPATASAAAHARDGLLVVDNFATGQIYTLTSSGTHVAQITHVPTGQLALAPRWSRDGRRIAFVLIANGPDRMYTMAPDGSGVHPVLDDGPAWNDDAPEFLPSGDRIAFARCHTDGSGCVIATVGVDGTGLRAVTAPRHEVYDFLPAVSPQGRRIAFVRFNADGVHSRVWVMNANGTGAHPITPAALEATIPRWSPDGTHIVFSSNCCRLGGDVYRVPASGGHPRRLTQTRWPNASVFGVYSPSGHRIAFTSNRNYPDRSGSDLFLMRPNGTHETKVDTGLGGVNSVDWAPATTG